MKAQTAKKVLYCASTTQHLRQFHLPYLQGLHNKGCYVAVCAEKFEELPFADEVFAVPFRKSFISLENLRNVVRVHRLLCQENFDVVYTHTQLASAIVRAAVLLLPRERRPKVVVICHGYLFNEKSGVGKWKYLLPEKIFARVTDVLLVMNQEDYGIVQKYHLCCGKIGMIPGMGVNFAKFDIPHSRDTLVRKYGAVDNTVNFVFAGEFSSRKNQRELIAAFARAQGQMPNVRLILAGEGMLRSDCQAQTEKLGLRDKIVFPGYVRNMAALYHCSDVCVSASRSEGLPFNIMEAMYCNLACIVSDVKGHRDLLIHGENGLLYESGDVEQLAACMVRLYRDSVLRRQLGERARETVEPYSLDRVYPIVMEAYGE